jgi:hypothetical protein
MCITNSSSPKHGRRHGGAPARGWEPPRPSQDDGKRGTSICCFTCHVGFVCLLLFVILHQWSGASYAELQQPDLFQPRHDLRHTFLHGVLVRANRDLRVQRRLVRRRDARELLDLAGPRLLVQALGVALLGHLEGQVDVDLDEAERLVRAAVGAGRLGVKLTGRLAVGAVGRDEGGERYGGGVGEELGYLGGALSACRGFLGVHVFRIRSRCGDCKGGKGRGTSAMRRMFSLRSFSENPRSLFRPKRTLSPSSRYAARPRWRRCCSRAVATVDLPEADRPVNQTVKPFCLRSSLRSRRERDGCHVMFLEGRRRSRN